MRLREKLLRLAEGMSPQERACFKILLGAATAELIKRDGPPDGTRPASPLATTIGAVAQLQPHRNRVPPNGVVYRGRPPFVTDDLIATLRAESDALRSTAIRFHDHLVVSGAPTARAVAFSPEMNDFIRGCAGMVVPTTKANYLYYDEPGLGIEPHVDNEDFSLNAIMMLRHDCVALPSALVLYPVASPPERIYLKPGELVVMFADSVVHARESVTANERIAIVAFGFSPTSAL